MSNGPRTQRMTSSIERVFRAINFAGYNGPAIYREIFLHWVHFIDPETSKTIGSKLDKNILGDFYRVAKDNENSIHGIIEYKFPNAEKPVKLIALATDVNGNPVIQ